MRNVLKFVGIIILFEIIIVSQLVSCTGKTSTGTSSSAENKTTVSSWDEGFNTSWVGTYESKKDADYAVVFKLSEDGNYNFTYGEGLTTTYSGKYNKNFRNGQSQSKLKYTITGLRIISFDEKTITISTDWKLPSGNNTEAYILYRK